LRSENCGIGVVDVAVKERARKSGRLWKNSEKISWRAV